MKLYAIIENEEGKQVKIGSNERITATLYEGNKKQYAVNIAIEEGDEKLPEFHAEKGSIITTREWRNMPNKTSLKQKGNKWQDVDIQTGELINRHE